jgi:hypothetical protein
MAIEGINTTKLSEQLEETINEIAFLQSYARSLPGDRITEKAKDALSEFAVQDFSDPGRITQEQLKLALTTHGLLCEIVLPATIRSLKATDAGQPFWSGLRQVWAIPIVAMCTVIAFGVFVYESSIDVRNNVKASAGSAPVKVIQDPVVDTKKVDPNPALDGAKDGPKPVPSEAQDGQQSVP